MNWPYVPWNPRARRAIITHKKEGQKVHNGKRQKNSNHSNSLKIFCFFPRAQALSHFEICYLSVYIYLWMHIYDAQEEDGIRYDVVVLYIACE